jgi:ABC-type uncharacterized transport system auxiliary subunit
MDTTQVDRPLTSQICEIATVKMPPAYAQHRIAVRKRSHEISYYQYHHWAMAPEEILSNLIEKRVQSANIFTSVSRFMWEIIPDFQINSSVYQIEAIDKDDRLHAHLNMRLDLISQDKNIMAVTHQFDKMVPLNEHDLNLFARTLSSILQDEISIFAEKMKMYFQNRQ